MDQSGASKAYRLFVGIDIAALTVTVASKMPTAAVTRPITIEQTPQGFAALQKHLLATGSAAAEILVVLEATGSYWITLATTLAHAGFAIWPIYVPS